MARIRTIKPEFWTSEQIVECSPIARLMFVGMWNFADDGGNLPASAKTLKMQIFPADNIDVTPLVEELLAAGLIIEYSVSGRKYWNITGWHHQKIDRPTIKHPSMDQGEVVEPSSSPRRVVVEPSPPEGKGRESKGRESKGEDDARKRAHRLPSDWRLDEKGHQFAVDQGIAPEDVSSVADQFRDHWHANGETKIDWSAAWRTWVRNELKFNPPSKSSPRKPVYTAAI